MAEKRVVTAAELEKMTPAERAAHFEASIVRDLDQVPPRLLERAREAVERHIAETESRQQ